MEQFELNIIKQIEENEKKYFKLKKKIEAKIMMLEHESEKVMEYHAHPDKYDLLDKIEDKIKILKDLLI